jgi:glycosyltransferase involved in cell wall biosynthesis
MKKKILLLSTRDSAGGASEWLFKLADALYKSGYEIVLIVTNQQRSESFIINIQIPNKKKSFLKRAINYFKRKFGIKNKILKSIPEYGFYSDEDESVSHISAEQIISKLSFKPDIIITGLIDGFVNTTVLLDLKNITDARIFQTAFDVSVFTGGCHVIWNCEGFKNDCSNCPALLNQFSYSSNNLKIKKHNIQRGNFGVLLVSGWSMLNANLSLLYKNALKVDVGSCVNTDLFTNKNRDIAKRLFHITNERKVIFAGSTNVNDLRKGIKYFVETLTLLWNDLSVIERENINILIIGNNNEENELVSQIKFKKQLITFITDQRLLALAYQAADIFVCPSIEDAGPLMIAEAMSCGTPVVGFEMGLLYDDTIIQNGYNGYRVKLKDTYALSVVITNILKLSRIEYDKMSLKARETALEFLSEKHFVDIVTKL